MPLTWQALLPFAGVLAGTLALLLLAIAACERDPRLRRRALGVLIVLALVVLTGLLLCARLAHLPPARS